MLRIRVLGPLGVEVRGEQAELGAARQRTALCLLLMARGAVVPTDRLADGLWRGAPPAKAMTSLHAYVSNLRRLLEPDRPPRAPATVLVTAPPGYALRLPDDAVDAWRFETWVGRARDATGEEARRLLAEALGWWRGTAFAEQAQEEWAAPEVARLSELRLEARELAVTADLCTGRAAEAALGAATLVGESPLREEGWRLLALAQWKCGRQADALDSLRRATAVLREELGCEPGHALREVEHALLNPGTDVLNRHTDLLDAFGHGGPVTMTSLRATRPQETASPPGGLPRRVRALFVGRRAELAAAEAAARAARADGGTVLVTGEAGAGKSALLERIGEHLRRDGWRVVVGRCPEYEGAPSAWAWAEALGDLARQAPPARPDALAALLGDTMNEAVADRDEATAGRFRLHLAFTEWLRTVADAAPLAVVIEDLHRADSETLALLEAAAAVQGTPLLVLASYRPAEPAPRLVKTLATLASGAPQRIALGGLQPGEVTTIVEAVCVGPVDADTVAALARRTGGNPFYVLESARLLASEGALVAVSEVPQGVRDVLRRRLALLPAAARTAVQLTAVVGLEAELSLLAAASDESEEELVEGLEAALAADLLTESRPGRVRFVHALVRDTVYTDLSWPRRSRAHSRVARALLDHRPDDSAALAHHFARSGSTADAPLAVDHALRAAEAAERRYAHETAVDLIEQAVDAHTTAGGAPDRTVGLLVRLLGAQVRAGATEAALRTRRRAVDLAERSGRNDLVATAYAAWIEPSPWRSRLESFYDRTSPARLEALAADPGLDDPTRARVLQVLVELVAADDVPRALEASRAQLALARTIGEPRLLASALMTAAKQLPYEVQTAARGPLVAELRALVRDHDFPAYHWICEHLDGLTAAARNDPAGMRRHVTEGLRIARRYGLVWAQGLSTVTWAMLETIAGRFDAAEATYLEARGLLERVGAHHADSLHALAWFTIRLAQGRPAEVEPVMREVYARVGAPVGAAFALVLIRLGRLDEAGEVGLSPKVPTDHLYGMELDYRAEIAVRLRDTDAARPLVADLSQVCDQLGSAVGGAYATRPLAQALGDLHRLLGEHPAAVENYALAERVAHSWKAPHLVTDARRAQAELAAERDGRRLFIV
ncbi:BTAD domain-containing putative transcriptional regulator [Streptomyces sp. NPDC057690]|uniref:BTAD domain-containing putative transcriptional regulator n=1 Tax=Streptomyces sp. NPDC057690 TaxID=3346214 RepID=UPI0036A9A663